MPDYITTISFVVGVNLFVGLLNIVVSFGNIWSARKNIETAKILTGLAERAASSPAKQRPRKTMEPVDFSNPDTNVRFERDQK